MTSKCDNLHKLTRRIDVVQDLKKIPECEESAESRTSPSTICPVEDPVGMCSLGTPHPKFVESDSPDLNSSNLHNLSQHPSCKQI